jgi:hypothetical protein
MSQVNIKWAKFVGKILKKKKLIQSMIAKVGFEKGPNNIETNYRVLATLFMLNIRSDQLKLYINKESDA